MLALIHLIVLVISFHGIQYNLNYQSFTNETITNQSANDKTENDGVKSNKDDSEDGYYYSGTIPKSIQIQITRTPIITYQKNSKKILSKMIE